MNKCKGLTLCTICITISMILSGCINVTNQKKIQISVGDWPSQEKNPNEYAAAEKCLEEFNKLYPDIEVTPVEWPYDPNTFISKAEGGTLPTLYVAPFTEAGKIMKLGYAADITKYMRKKGFDMKINEYILGNISEHGSIYLMPISSYSLGLFMNINLFEQAGLLESDGTPKAPKTFEELAETAQIIKKKTGIPGFVMPTTGRKGGWIFTAIAWNFGGNFIEQNENGEWKAVFDSVECANALQFVKDLKWKYNVLPVKINIADSSFKEIIGNGGAAMGIMAPDKLDTLINTYGMSKDDVGYGVMPTNEEECISLMGGSYYIIEPHATEAQIDACFKWMELFKGISPELTDVTKQTMEKEFKNKQETNGIIGIHDVSLWNERSEVQAYRSELEKKYCNVNYNHIKLYNDAKDIEYQTEEPICAQELYEILGDCIQKVLIDRDADCMAVLKKAAEDFQQNCLDYE